MKLEDNKEVAATLDKLSAKPSNERYAKKIELLNNLRQEIPWLDLNFKSDALDLSLKTITNLLIDLKKIDLQLSISLEKDFNNIKNTLDQVENLINLFGKKVHG